LQYSASTHILREVEGLQKVIAKVGSFSKVEMTASMALIYKVLFLSISTFETPPLHDFLSKICDTATPRTTRVGDAVICPVPA
jgi:hypothetical protein